MSSSAAAQPWEYDPLGYGITLPLSASYCPLGFPMSLHTNSADVLAAAEETWTGFPRFFDEPPMEVRVIAGSQSGGGHASSLQIRAQRHLLSLISDEYNFAVCDPSQSFALCFVTRETAADHAWFRYFYLETIPNMIRWNTHLTRIHAACVERNGHGVLFCGESGAGKSCLAYACARSGWTLISDEAPSIVRRTTERIVIGKPQQIHLRETAFDLFPELRGRDATPNPVGKITFEVKTRELPRARTGFRATIDAVVFLRRGQREQAGLVPLSTEEAASRLLADLPYFPQPAHEEHIQTLRNLVRAPAFELHYQELAQAIAELERITQ